MALNFNVLAQTPSIAERFMAGRQAAQEEQQRNMLLQQRQMEFQQAQEDRLRTQRQEAQFEKMADLIRQNGMDPDDPKVLGQFAQAAMAARQPQLVSFVTSMAERAAKRREEQRRRARAAEIMGGEESAAAPAGAVVAPPVAAPAAAAAPAAEPYVPLEKQPPMSSGAAFLQDMSAYLTSRGYAPPLSRGPSAAATTIPVGEFAGQVTPAPSAEGIAEGMVPVNALAPEPALLPPPVNAMVTPTAAPSVQVAGPAALPTAAPKIDVTALEDELEKLQRRHDRLLAEGLDKEATTFYNSKIKPLERRIERASKVTERQSPLMRDVVAFGFPPTAEGLAKFEAAKRDPDTVGTKEYNLAVRQGFKGTLLDYKKELAEAGRSKIDVGVQAFEPANIQAQKEFISAASKQRETLLNAPNIIENVNAAKQLIPGASAFMGKGGEPLLAAASFLNNRLGFSINTKGVTDATELNTRLFEGILENLKRLDSQPTQQQQNALREALGSLGTDPAALPRILDRIEDSLRNRVDRYNKDVTSAEQRGIKFPFEPLIELPPRVRPAAIPTAPAATPAAAQPIYARNPTTNERIMSTDGGRTWSPAR